MPKYEHFSSIPANQTASELLLSGLPVTRELQKADKARWFLQSRWLEGWGLPMADLANKVWHEFVFQQ